MDMKIDAEQIAHVLDYLAQLRRDRDRGGADVPERLRPAWISMGAWDVILEDLAAQRYRERERAHPRLQLVRLS
jgi:hypothetical protein